jgi:hypothetical protein
MTNKRYTIPNPKEITKKEFQEHHKWLTHNFEQDKNNKHIFHKKENNNITNDQLEKIATKATLDLDNMTIKEV